MSWSWITAIATSLIVWFTTHFYYQNELAELELAHKQEIIEQREATVAAFDKQAKLEKKKYEELFDEYAKVRNDNASIRTTNERLRNQVSALSRLSAGKSRATLIKELDECRKVAVGLSELAGQAYEAFELIDRTDQIERKYNSVDKP